MTDFELTRASGRPPPVLHPRGGHAARRRLPRRHHDRDERRRRRELDALQARVLATDDPRDRRRRDGDRRVHGPDLQPRGRLRWDGRDMTIDATSIWRSRFALVEDGRDLVVFDAKGWGSRPVTWRSRSLAPWSPASSSSPPSSSDGSPPTRAATAARRAPRPWAASTRRPVDGPLACRRDQRDPGHPRPAATGAGAGAGVHAPGGGGRPRAARGVDRRPGLGQRRHGVLRGLLVDEPQLAPRRDRRRRGPAARSSTTG